MTTNHPTPSFHIGDGMATGTPADCLHPDRTPLRQAAARRCAQRPLRFRSGDRARPDHPP
ncbi:hypothetical protein ACRAWF_32415 [Streptomyces sp. L7]